MIHPRILIVENKSIIAEDIRHKLIHIGYEISACVRSGKQAIQSIEKEQPALILMDIRIDGDLNGIETIKKIQENYNIPVIYLTAYSDDLTLKEAKATNPYGYIVKPFSERDLHTTIEMALNLFNMENKLLENEQWFSTILHSIVDGVIATDSEKKIKFMNSAAEELTGRDKAYSLYRDVGEILNLTTLDNSKCTDDFVASLNSCNGNANISDPMYLFGRKGSKRAIRSRSANIRDKYGKMIGTVLVLQDITLELQAENELIRSQKLESLGVLAGGIAHDFNNLLTSIIGNIDLAMFQSENNHHESKELGQALFACEKAKRLTNKLLTFSQGGAPLMEVRDISDLLKDACGFAIVGSKVNCQFKIQNNLWLVNIDSGQIEQALYNLITNAVQALPNGGAINVSAENTFLKHSPVMPLESGEYVKICISDKGVGIPRQYLTKVFDPYFTTKQGSSGLGLASSYSIIKKHKGHLNISSTENLGTEVTLYIPKSNVEKKIESEETKLPALDNLKLLFMDDEELIRTVTAKLLSTTGCKIELAEDGQEAINKFNEAKRDGKPFDTIIMDLTVPGGMGGEEAIKAIRKEDKEVTVIVSSGYSQNPVMAAYREYGFDGILKKPYNYYKLCNILAEIQNKKPLQEA